MAEKKVPPFSAQLHSAVGDSDTLVLACTGSTPKELATNVAHLRDVARAERKKHNDAVLDTRRAVTEASFDSVGRGVRALCEASGLPVPAEYRLPNGHDAQEGGSHADPSGAVHAPADS